MKRSGHRIRAVVGITALAVAVIGLGAGVAWGHVLVQPPSLPKGATDVIFGFSAPNESSTGASVTALEVDFPTDHPLLSVMPQTVAGWTAKVVSSKLAKPVTTDDGTITEAVSQITWTATAGGVAPGQFGLFSVLAGQLPSDTSKLVIKAIQSYSDGTQVSWIETTVKGAPEPEHPAPVLKLTGKAPKS